MPAYDLTTNPINSSNNTNIYELERQAYKDLNDYYLVVSNTVECNRNDVNLDPKILNSIVSTCDNSKPKGGAAINSAYDKANASITKLQAAMNYVKGQSSSGTGVSNSEYAANYAKLLQDYRSMVDLRNKLDYDMKIFLDNDETIHNSSRSQYQTVMYSSLVVSVLATSLIYYVFVKL